MKVVVILPTYNERENIERLLDELHRVTSHIHGYSFSFLVVDDASPDGTQDVVSSYKKNHADVFLITGKKQGLGKALLRGMEYAVNVMHTDVIVQMDADLSHDPSVLPQFFEALDQGADFVVGSRYIPGGSIPSNWGLHRKIFSVVGNAIVRFGLGFPDIHDWTGGYRAYREKFVEAMRQKVSHYSGYVFQIAFLHQSVLHKAHVVEVPIHFTDRRFGHSKIAPSEYIRNVFQYVFSQRLHTVTRGSFGKFLVVGTIGFIINTAVLELLVHWGIHPAIGSIVGAELAIVSNFILNNHWTFKERKIYGFAQIRKFIQFNVTSVGAVVIQAFSVAFGTMAFGFNSYRLFYLIGVGIGLVWNYVMYSRVIWKHRK